MHHVTGHGVAALELFADEIDRQLFVIRLARAIRSHDWVVYAACILNTHFHLVVSGELPRGMQSLQGAYAKTFNARHQRRGAVWEGRYRPRELADDAHLREAIRYVALNPVRAGVVDRPQDDPWSTYAELLGRRPIWPGFDPSHALGLFSGLAQLRDYVEVWRPQELHKGSPTFSKNVGDPWGNTPSPPRR